MTMNESLHCRIRINVAGLYGRGCFFSVEDWNDCKRKSWHDYLQQSDESTLKSIHQWCIER